MRHIFIVLLGLSFAMAAHAADTSKTSPEQVLPSKEKNEPRALCNPQEETKMPETFY